MMSTSGNTCPSCHGTTHVRGVFGSTHPCPHCTDSGTPDLDMKVGIRYAAGINAEGKLMRPITECLNKDGTVRFPRYGQ